ncbi:hypothetical protein KC351_g17349 [Hortaea werneckii]|nr:hypothetical protein KC351_g17349 [Hortaea werneckii]
MSPYLTSLASEEGDNIAKGLRHVAQHLDADPTLLSTSLDPFTITTSTGFMPLHTPIVDLPKAFDALTKILEKMPIVKEDGTPGLLATYQLGPTIDNGALPDLLPKIDELQTVDGKPDLALATAAFRDYAFLASAYLLEPCWERWSKGLEGYGLGRAVLPRCIAGPLVKTAKLLDIPPFMSYAAAYTLYNYRFANQSTGAPDYSNLRLVRGFERGLDPTTSEAGFVLTHVDMVKHSGSLVKGATQLLDAAASNAGAESTNDAFDLLLDTMRVVEESMESMWSHSKPKDYLSYRTFIFGITNQSMFPEGVIYEGENGGKPMSFRGESGANDSMIPLLDGLLQIPMPTNPLTEILKDFRSYRPKPHREFLAAVREQAEEVGVREHCCRDVDTTVRYLRLLEHVRSFRWRHWLFAREYIIRRSTHPTATGGSPIVTWLPNQLQAVMKLMTSTWEGIPAEQRSEVSKDVVEMMENVVDQRDKLQKEVDRWCQERGQ